MPDPACHSSSARLRYRWRLETFDDPRYSIYTLYAGQPPQFLNTGLAVHAAVTPRRLGPTSVFTGPAVGRYGQEVANVISPDHNFSIPKSWTLRKIRGGLFNSLTRVLGRPVANDPA